MTITTLDITVVALGVATIGWIYWYFFRADQSAATAQLVGGTQVVNIAVHGGYSPSTVRVRSGAPIQLVFDRQETSSCSEEVVFGDFGVRKFLPAFQKTTVDLAPQRSGTYDFTCGMSMLHGKLIVE